MWIRYDLGAEATIRSVDREMTADGSDEAGWSPRTGTHPVVIREAVTAVPAEKPDVVAGQIHDGDHDVSVFRLEGNKLSVTKGDTSEGYFKAGAYTQANCGNSEPCGDINYGEVVIHDIDLSHS